MTISPTFALQAHTLLEKGRVEEAIALCERGLEIYPDYATAYSILAQAYERMENSGRANDVLERGIRRLPLERSLLRMKTVKGSNRSIPSSLSSGMPSQAIERTENITAPAFVAMPESPNYEDEVREDRRLEDEVQEVGRLEEEVQEDRRLEEEAQEDRKLEEEVQEDGRQKTEFQDMEIRESDLNSEIELPEPSKPEVQEPEPEIELPEHQEPEIQEPEQEPGIELPEQEPEIELPEPSKPEIELPEPGKPEIQEPEPEIELPEHQEPEIQEPEQEPGIGLPEQEPEIELPEPSKPEIELPEPGKPEIQKPEPEIELPEHQEPEIQEPEQEPGIERPEPGKPEIQEPEQEPEIELPEPNKPEIELPEPNKPEIELPEPGEHNEPVSNIIKPIGGNGTLHSLSLRPNGDDSSASGSAAPRHSHLRIIESADTTEMPSLIWRSRNVRLIPGLEFTPLRFESKKDKLYRPAYRIPDPPPFPEFEVTKKKPIRFQQRPDDSRTALTPLEELARRLEAARIPRVEEEESHPLPPPPTAPRAEQSSPMITETMAKIYEMQGAISEAIKAYEALARQKPEMAEQYTKKVRDLKNKL